MQYEKLSKNIFRPLSGALATLHRAVNEYEFARTNYERDRTQYFTTYHRALMQLKEAHRQWKKLFSELTQARRL